MRGFVYFESVRVTTDPARAKFVTITVEKRSLWGIFNRRRVTSVELPLSAAVRVADDLTQAAMRGYADSQGARK